MNIALPSLKGPNIRYEQTQLGLSVHLNVEGFTSRGLYKKIEKSIENVTRINLKTWKEPSIDSEYPLLNMVAMTQYLAFTCLSGKTRHKLLVKDKTEELYYGKSTTPQITKQITFEYTQETITS